MLSSISLFRIILLNYLDNLNDLKTKELLKEIFRTMRFCGFLLEGTILVHTILCRFRNKIVIKEPMTSY
ncbi:MAG: transposase [Flavobacteriales bacterium Tduv]